MAAEPKCPDCGVQGMNHIVSRESVERSRHRQPWFLVIHCNACGHVYDVIAKHVFSHSVPPRLVLPDHR
ncbi:MAG: hypothetical protein RIC56_20615 [Pseudomonadales bacterium]